jgi:hypothetical protein
MPSSVGGRRPRCSRRGSAARTADLIPVVEAIRAEGITSAIGIAKVLNDRGTPTI